MAKYRNQDHTGKVIQQWLRNSKTIDFIGLWEKVNNPDFRNLSHINIREKAGSNNFSVSVKKWIKETGAIGFISK